MGGRTVPPRLLTSGPPSGLLAVHRLRRPPWMGGRTVPPRHVQRMTLRYFVQPLGKLDHRAPWIDDGCCSDVVQFRSLAVRSRELDALGLELSAELREILH